ncbi:2,3-dihydroxybenzoate--AMP ligase [Streptomyces caatingaensis]|uniref:2,3-dihydroxybenzoate--AMP ligase n=1 Tax=Streptomyces caatingaensis TaxID=1678637 RepID=A0A0K9XB93_9ACTN|nr:2,3-dihydroxybenzoate--AMP ligase [Streptomyces caatingaensis]
MSRAAPRRWPVIAGERAERYRREGLWRAERIDEIVLAHAASRPGAPALVCGERRLTHGELAAAVGAAARRLAALGVRRGSPVVVQLPNGVELVVLTLALSRLGAPPVLTPVTLRAFELEHIVSVTRPAALALPRRHARFDHLALGRALRDGHPGPEGPMALLVTGGRPEDAADTVDLTALCAPPDGPYEAGGEGEPAGPGDPAVCLLSNGTTGRPKVIPRLHEAYGHQLRHTPAVAGVGPDAIYLAVMPATHGFVLGCPGVLGTLSAGGTVVLGGSAEPAAAFELIEREGVTHTTLVPALAERWAEAASEPGTPDLSSLRVLQVGGARPHPRQIERIPEALGCRVQQCYGMSEGLLCYTALDDPDEVVLGTQGRPLSPADEILVLDDEGAPVADGGVGELLTRGPYTVAGYLGDPAADASAFTTDGFYRTGDLVRVHPSGALVVEGRTRDVVNRGGEKIPAAELDLLAAEHPAVAAAAAVAAPHPRFGEIVCLYVVPCAGRSLDLEDVRAFLRSRGLAGFKLPERLEVVDGLPYLGIGKVDKAALRRRAAAR